MNIIDVVIILFILLMAVTGWKKGFIRSVVSAVGIILVFVLAFYLKNPIAEWLSLNLPFFSFWGDFKNVTILNVVIYQFIAFFIVYSLLMTLYSIVVFISKFIEKLLKMTIILGIPSKILGFIFGLFEGVIIATIALMFLSLPILGLDLVHESKLKSILFETTPVVSDMMGSTSQAVTEIMDLRQEFSSNSTKDKFNEESLNILLKYNIIEIDYAKKLINSGKLKIDVENANNIISNYE